MSRGISLDVELAREVGLAPAIVYNELLFWNKRGQRDDGWIYKSYEDMVSRLPLSERTIRDSYKKLKEFGYIDTKIMRVNGSPTLHYIICRMETAESAETIETAESAETSIYTKKVPIEGAKKSRKELEQSLLLLVNSIIGRDFRVLPATGVKKTLDAFSLSEIEIALKALKEDDWHRDKLKEFKIDYLVRSTTIDKFLALGKPKRDPRVYGDQA